VPISNFYLRHKGLFINLFSVITFLGIHHSLGKGGPDALGEMPWLALLFIVLFFLEPWATRYSMGAFNQRRETAGLSPILLHRWMRMIFPAIIFWGGRIAILGALFVFCLQALGLQFLLDHTAPLVIIWLGLIVREGFVVYYMGSQQPLPDFRESNDFLADLILMIILAFGQLVVGEVFRDYGVKALNSVADFFLLLFPIGLFFFVFYLPVRYIYTVEDFTFAQTKWWKAEQVVSFFLVFLGFLLAR